MTTTHTCPKCKRQVSVDVDATAYCLTCGVTMTLTHNALKAQNNVSAVQAGTAKEIL